MELVDYPKIDTLVAFLKDKNDLSILKDQGWYRIPVKSAPCNPNDLKYIAFYQPAIFGNDKWLVQYFGKIHSVKQVKRKTLFPREPENPKTNELYYKVQIESLEKLENPIAGMLGRRIVFIPTIFEKLLNAGEINDLFHTSPLEDKLWTELKKEKINAERQFYVREGTANYYLDFALLCKRRNVDVECDGDKWHITKESAVRDNERDNLLNRIGWLILRFSTPQLAEMGKCLYNIKDAINKSGGLNTYENTVRWMEIQNREGDTQLELF
jgi:very-short-patch-repair endonuclease